MANAQPVKSLRGRLRRGSAISARQRIEVMSLCVLFTLVVVTAGLGGWFAGLINTRPAQQEAAEPAPTIDDFRIGSITYVPVKGPNCEVHRFDNFTGAVVPDGYVNCERKLNPEGADPLGPDTQRGARMKAVLGGFKK